MWKDPGVLPQREEKPKRKSWSQQPTEEILGMGGGRARGHIFALPSPSGNVDPGSQVCCWEHRGKEGVDEPALQRLESLSEQMVKELEPQRELSCRRASYLC